MKQGIFAAIVLGALLLSGCGQSVALISGADGPAGTEAAEGKPVRMLRVEGALYYDSGTDSDMARCGNLDGSLSKSADPFEVPRQDGGCNFEGAEGYQNASELTKEVPLDGGWRIFKKLDDPEKDLLGYKYCYSLRGAMPNAEGESEWLILANDRNLNFDQVARSLYSSDSEDALDIYIFSMT